MRSAGTNQTIEAQNKLQCLVVIVVIGLSSGSSGSRSSGNCSGASPDPLFLSALPLHRRHALLLTSHIKLYSHFTMFLSRTYFLSAFFTVTGLALAIIFRSFWAVVPAVGGPASVKQFGSALKSRNMSSNTRTPVYFVSHGGPNIKYDTAHPAYARLTALGREITTTVKFKAILVLSAHWEGTATTLSINTAPSTPLIYDFGGFPSHYYRAKYPHTGSPQLAESALRLLADAGIPAKPATRGLDHGVWVPFSILFNPETNPVSVPIVQLSLFDSDSGDAHYALGEALAPLRDEGVLIIVSGQAVHNLPDFMASRGSLKPRDYALSFDEALKVAVEADPAERRGKMAELLKRSDARRAHPTFEHLLPVFVGAGAAKEDRGLKGQRFYGPVPTFYSKVAAAVYTITDSVRNVDTNVSGLHQELMGFSGTLSAIEKTWKQNTTVLMAYSGPDATIWTSVTENLDNSKLTLEMLEKVLTSVKKGGFFGHGILTKPTKAARLSLSKADITTYQHRINSHHIVMQGGLQMIGLCLHIKGNGSLQSLETSVAKLGDMIKLISKRAEMALQGIKDPSSNPSQEENQNSNMALGLQSLARAAESVFTSASTVIDGRRSTIYGGSIVGDNTSPVYGEHMDRVEKLKAYLQTYLQTQATGIPIRKKVLAVSRSPENPGIPLVLPPSTSTKRFKDYIVQAESICGADNLIIVTKAEETYKKLLKALDMLNLTISDQDNLLVSAIVRPRKASEAQEIVLLCNTFEIPVWSFSSGSNADYRAAIPRVPGSIGLDFGCYMNKVLGVHESGAYVVVEPGATSKNIDQYLVDNKLIQKFEFNWPRRLERLALGNIVEDNMLTFYCGKEIILPNGDLLKMGSIQLPGIQPAANNVSQVEQPETKEKQTLDYSLGIFNGKLLPENGLGIAVKLAICLTPNSGGCGSYRIIFSRDENLTKIVDIAQELRQTMVIQNSLDVLRRGPNASYASANAPLVDIEIDGANAARWYFYGTIHGPEHVRSALWQITKDAFSQVEGAKFFFQEGFKHKQVRVITGGSHVVFHFTSDVSGDVANAQHSIMKKCIQEAGFDFESAFTIKARKMHYVLYIMYDRYESGFRGRVHKLVRTMMDVCVENGWTEYRTYGALMDQIAATRDVPDDALAKINKQIKDAIDPAGIMEPGRNGVWPTRSDKSVWKRMADRSLVE
ncbi:hypothetical protein V502_08441 [Pseudogymnoascus sp. VKM F-4520 (FW-2644)]|nr:hypothetical protein V502_08441 [Pseudogymnoascus sp. VKM F-4520 (FW-2644)]